MISEPLDFREIAAVFASLAYDSDAKRTVHIQAGGFVWSDETPDFRTAETPSIPIRRFMIALISYRATLIRGVPHEPFTPYWEAFQHCCPSWPGFRSDRCARDLAGDLDLELNAEFDRLERMLKICERKKARRTRAATPQSRRRQ
jgi:hypothetical protein